jgi:hypothetical protein
MQEIVLSTPLKTSFIIMGAFCALWSLYKVFHSVITKKIAIGFIWIHFLNICYQLATALYAQQVWGNNLEHATTVIFLSYLVILSILLQNMNILECFALLKPKFKNIIIKCLRYFAYAEMVICFGLWMAFIFADAYWTQMAVYLSNINCGMFAGITIIEQSIQSFWIIRTVYQLGISESESVKLPYIDELYKQLLLMFTGVLILDWYQVLTKGSNDLLCNLYFRTI